MKPHRYDIYYRIDGKGFSMFSRKTLLAETTIANLSDIPKFVLLMRGKHADNLEHLFYLMQGEVWSPNGEANAFIRSKGCDHTSMSVGDVVQDLDTGKYYVCAPVGWEEIS